MKPPGLIRRLLQRAVLGKTYDGDGRAGAGGFSTLLGTCVVEDSSSVFRSLSTQEIYALQKTSSLVATCANKIATSVRNGDLALWEEGEDGEEKVDADESEGTKNRKGRRLRSKALAGAPDAVRNVAQRLKNPNPYMSQGDIVEVLVKGLVLVGDVYLWLWRDAYGFITEMWPIPKTWVTANKDTSGVVTGYSIWQGSSAAAKVVPVEDLVRIWCPDAENPMNAIGAAEIVSRELQLDDERAAYLMELLKNVPFAGAVFKQKGEWDTEQKAEIKAKVQENIGRGARGSVAFVSGENAGVDFPNPLADLDWPGLMNYLESRVSAALDIPAIVAGFRVGLEHGTYANFKEANRMFYRGRVSGIGLKICEALTRGIVYAVAPESGYWIAFDWSEVDAMQDDEDAKETRILNRLKGAAITRNEARISLGEDAVDGGDVFLDSAGVIPTPADADPWSGDTGRKPRAPMDWTEEPAKPEPPPDTDPVSLSEPLSRRNGKAGV
jgi:phage portal protein BeeE